MIYVFSSTILSPGLFINLFTCLLSNISQLVSLSIYLVCLFVCQFVGQKFNLPIYCIISTRFCIYQPLFFSSFLSVCPTGSQFVWQFVCLFGIITVLFFSYTFWQFFHLSVSLSVCSEMSMKSGVFCTFFLEFANFSRYVWGGFQKYFLYFCSFIQFLYLSFMSSQSPEFFHLNMQVYIQCAKSIRMYTVKAHKGGHNSGLQNKNYFISKLWVTLGMPYIKKWLNLTFHFSYIYPKQHGT